MAITLTQEQKNKIIQELQARNCSTHASWFKDNKTLSDWVYKCTGKSISDLLSK